MWEQYAFWGVYFSGAVSCVMVGFASVLNMHDRGEKLQFLGTALLASLFWPVAAPALAVWCLWKDARNP